MRLFPVAAFTLLTVDVYPLSPQQHSPMVQKDNSDEQHRMDHQEGMSHAGHATPGMQHDHASPAQTPAKPGGAAMPGHQQMGMPGMPGMGHMNTAGMWLMNEASGTSLNPEAWPMPMITVPARGWNLMFMGQAFLLDTQQSGPRGADKLYSTNWVMADAEHRAGDGSIMGEVMLSLEPATIRNRRYPELFQTGETAYGQPLVNAQHPHDFIMSLGVHYAHPLGESAILEAYVAPVGDPALGPVAYPHRASAMEIPQATLGHHWQDSTHIADDVITVGVKYRFVRVEASGFYGSEPDEYRWDIDYGPINSWSTRISILPSKNWLAQVSMGRLARPEAQEPGDVIRSTASLEYVVPRLGSSWATSIIWGRNHDTFTRRNTNAYLLESEFPVRRNHILTGRIELVDKDELFANEQGIEDFLARTAGSTFRIGAYTIGYTRDFDLIRNARTGIGANFTAYSLPGSIQPFYGGHPFGVNVYLRVRLRP